MSDDDQELLRRTLENQTRLLDEIERLRAELHRHKLLAESLAAVDFAAKVPPGYEHGLAAWITELVVRAESSSLPRTEDIQEIERLREHVAKRSDVIAKLTDDVMRIAKERDEARARIAELEADCDSYRATVLSMESRLSDATKAGTPYASERDAMNAMVMRVAELEAARDEARYVAKWFRDAYRKRISEADINDFVWTDRWPWLEDKSCGAE